MHLNEHRTLHTYTLFPVLYKKWPIFVGQLSPPLPHRSQTPESYPKKKSFVDQRKAGWALENPTVYYSYIPRPLPNIYSYSLCLTFAVLVVMHMQVLVKQLFLV